MRVYCLGCGKTLLVPAAYEEPAVELLQQHARKHAQQLAPDIWATARNDQPTNDLVATMTSEVVADDAEHAKAGLRQRRRRPTSSGC